MDIFPEYLNLLFYPVIASDHPNLSRLRGSNVGKKGQNWNKLCMIVWMTYEKLPSISIVLSEHYIKIEIVKIKSRR